MYTNELPEEMMKKIEDAFTDIDKCSKIIKEATARKRQATADVKSTIETIDLKQGESLESPRVGLYAKVVQGKQSRLSRDALAQLGVSQAILDLGTITKDSRPYIKVSHVGPDNAAHGVTTKGQSTSVYNYPKRSAHRLSAQRSETT